MKKALAVKMCSYKGIDKPVRRVYVPRVRHHRGDRQMAEVTKNVPLNLKFDVNGTPTGKSTDKATLHVQTNGYGWAWVTVGNDFATASFTLDEEQVAALVAALTATK